jgi:arylsulfatase A-like enzyme
VKASPHEFNLRIPFALLPSNIVTEPRTVGASCSNVDFVPTLAELVGLAWPVALPGRSLAPALSGRALGPDPPTYAKMSAFGSRCDAIVLDGRKYMRFFDVDTGELMKQEVFDLRQDPRELDPLGSDFGAAAAVIAEQASDRGIAYTGTDEAPSEELEAQLRALGYVGGKAQR